MFEKDIEGAISEFNNDNNHGFYYNTPDNVLEDIKENNSSIIKEFKNEYGLFQLGKSIEDILKYLEQVYKDNPEYSYDIDKFIASLYLNKEDFENAKKYFLRCDDFEDAMYPCMELFNQTKDPQYMNEALDIAKKSLEDICRPKSKDIEENELIDYPIFNLVMEDCIQKDNFSEIIFLINSIHSSFRNNYKYRTFYYSLIKLAEVKDIKLSFQQNKAFFSRENFHTVCHQIKEALSNNSNDIDTVISFDNKIAMANDLKKKRDLLGAENQYREAMAISTTLKQKCMAFEKIYEMYENVDSSKMLSILDEFENEEVFENDFKKYYAKCNMVIKSNSIDCDTIELFKSMFKSLEGIEADAKYPNNIINLLVKCLELLKRYVKYTLDKELYDDAHSGCKLAIKFIDKFNKKSHYKVNEYRLYFNVTQKKCGDIKKDLAKKGNAKINIPVTAPTINKAPIFKETVTDPNDMPMFQFNAGILDHHQVIHSIEGNAILDEKDIKLQIKELFQQVQISKLIKSIYIQNDVFVGTPEQARADIDFYLNSTIRTNPIKKRDEYFSFVKIIQDVISRLGENAHYNITKKVMIGYILEAIRYHIKCLDDSLSIQYSLFIELIERKRISSEILLEIFN